MAIVGERRVKEVFCKLFAVYLSRLFAVISRRGEIRRKEKGGSRRGRRLRDCELM